MIDREGEVEVLLARYAAGDLRAPLHDLVAAHLELKQDSRRFVGGLEGLAAGMVEEAAPAPLEGGSAMLARIMAGQAESGEGLDAREPGWPRALAIYASGPDALSWKRILPGVRRVEIEDSDVEATFYRLKPGRAMPAHTHEGEEATLVLRGGFVESGRHYGVGDIAIANASVDHKPVADAGEECICFAVSTAPLRLTGPIGRIFERLRGLR